jgi:hypothetical protein
MINLPVLTYLHKYGKKGTVKMAWANGIIKIKTKYNKMSKKINNTQTDNLKYGLK